MTDLKLFNSLTREIEPFQPIHEGEARVYTCGPTVYNYQHIGNMRAYVFADTLGRTLQHNGLKLTHVINITDVGHLTSDADEGEDKMEKMAASQGKSAWDIAKFYQEDFERDLGRLNVQKKQHPRATEYVEEMIAWGVNMADKHCYECETGLYFDTTTVADYGRLARAVTEECAEETRGRIETVEGKRNAADFAIWRKTPDGESRQMEWDSPWGKGAPGWHLECSVMIAAGLGKTIDIHCGGQDLRFPHHENEIAQSACAHDDAPLARYWMHNGFLRMGADKMSKSIGNVVLTHELLKAWPGEVVRWALLSAHYRQPLEWTADLLKQSKAQLDRFYRVLEGASDADAIAVPSSVVAALDDDLNTPEAYAALHALRDAGDVAGLRSAGALLGFFQTDPEQWFRGDTGGGVSESAIDALLEERASVRQAKDFARSDEIRDELAAQGIIIEDGPDGATWRRS